MYIVWHQPGVLPCIALGVIVVTMLGSEWVEWSVELAVGTDAAHESGFLVEVSAVRFSSLLEILGVCLLAQHARHLGNAGISQGIFQTLCHGFLGLLLVVRQIAVFLEQPQSAVFSQRRLLHCLVGAFLILHVALQYHVGKHRDAWVAHHAVGFVTHQMPYRQLTLLAIDVDEGACHIWQHIGMNHRHQRMSRTIGIPEREGGVVGEIAVVYLAVGTAILSVYIREYGWSGHGVIHRRVEDAA